MLVAGSVVMAGQSGTKQLFLMDGDMWGGGGSARASQLNLQHLHQKSILSIGPLLVRQSWRDPGQTSKQVRIFRVEIHISISCLSAKL